VKTEIDKGIIDKIMDENSVKQSKKTNEDTSENQNNEKKVKTLWQFIKFGLVGVSNTVVSLSVYMICCHVIGTNVHIANAMGFVISVSWAYFMQSRFVFKEDETKEKRVWWKALIKTYVAYSFTGLFLTELLLIFWLNIVNLSQYITPLAMWLKTNINLTMSNVKLAETIVPFMNMVVTIPINFCVNKFWAYRQKPTQPAE
jgi:putative flippase GtrA